MSHFRDLLLDLKEYPQALLFLEAFGFATDDDVVFSASNQVIGDSLHDGQVSFDLEGREGSGFFLVGVDDRISFFDKNFPNNISSIHVPGISKWADKIDPKYLIDHAPQLPPNLAKAEADEIKKTRALMLKLGFTPTGKLGENFLEEYLTLPADHPAQPLIKKLFKDLENAISNSEKDGKDVTKIFEKCFYILHGLKSAKVFFEAGKIVWHKFPHLKNQKDINVVYPGAGHNVAALALPMALIDEGARRATVVFTESDESHLDKTEMVLREWIEVNPNLKGDLKPTVSQGFYGGKRVSYSLIYKGKTITLTYALKDSGRDWLYLSKKDLSTDIVVVDDPYSGEGQPDALLLYQILPHLQGRANPTAIVIPNELDRSNGPKKYGPMESVLPVQGYKIHGFIGCGGIFRINNERFGGVGGIGELGAPNNRSGLVISSADPFLKILQDKHDIYYFLTLAMLAGGQTDVTPIDPGVPRSTDRRAMERTRERVKSKDTLKGVDKTKIPDWVDSKIDKLSGASRELLILATVRFLVMYDNDYEIDYKPLILSQHLKSAMKEVLDKYHLGRDLKTIDKVILRLQKLE